MARRCRCLPLLLVVIATALSLPFPCVASPEATNSLQGGATSIQFLTFGGGFRTPFQNSGLYIKHHLTDRSAVRVGVAFSLDESSGKAPTGAAFGNVENIRDYSFTVSGDYVRHLDAARRVSLFIGIGPYWSRGRNFYEQTQTDPGSGTPFTHYFSDEIRIWEIGAAASAGFEWFVRGKLSVLGRVGASVGFGERHENTQNFASDGSNVLYDDSRRIDSTTATAGSSGAALGLSAYF